MLHGCTYAQNSKVRFHEISVIFVTVKFDNFVKKSSMFSDSINHRPIVSRKQKASFDEGVFYINNST